MDYNKMQREARSIRKDISTAESIIREALGKYIKKKLGAKSKKLANDMQAMFADLETYESEVDIQNAYGYDYITEREYARLVSLWRNREEFVRESGKFFDRVTEMIWHVIPLIGERYSGFLETAESQYRENDLRAKAIEMSNQRIAYERNHS